MRLNRRKMNILINGDWIDRIHTLFVIFMTFAAVTLIMYPWVDDALNYVIAETSYLKHVPAAVVTSAITFIKINI